MGVDVKLHVVIKGKKNWLKPNEVLPAAVHMAKVIGHENFFITKDTDNAEHFNNGQGFHAISLTESIDQEIMDEYGLSVLTQGKQYLFAGGSSPRIAENNEQFLDINCMGRYYGPGYERGDWPVIRTMIEYLLHKFKNAEILYGGDTGDGFDLMTPLKLDEYNRYYLTYGNMPYRNGFSSVGTNRGSIDCFRCEDPMSNTGGGGDAAFMYCAGCGQKAIVDTNGTTWLKSGEDFFEKIKEMHNEK